MTRVHLNHYRFRGGYARAPADGGIEHDTFDGTWVGAEQRMSLTPSPLCKLTLGGEGQFHYRVESASATTPAFLDDARPFQVGALYALADVTPSERLRLSAGVRLDDYSTFGRH